MIPFQKSLLSLSLILAMTLSSHVGMAAPTPLTGHSLFNKPQTSLATQQMGFELRLVPLKWTYKNPQSNASFQSIEIGPENSDSPFSLSFRSEKVSSKVQIENYVRQFLRDYNQYGFEVVQLRSFKNATRPFVVVDLNQKNKKYRSRQVFFHDKSQIVIATCIDEFDQFEKSLKDCNQVIDSITWLN